MRAEQIETKIRDLCQGLTHLEITDESHKHAGRKGTESHFKVIVVASDFEGQSRVQRQRQIYQVLDDEFKAGLHALSLRLLTPSEAQDQPSLFATPDCGGK